MDLSTTSRGVQLNLCRFQTQLVFQLRVTTPDGQPVSNEKVTITAKSYGSKLVYEKTFTVKNGLVPFTIDNVDHEFSYLSLEVSNLVSCPL